MRLFLSISFSLIVLLACNVSKKIPAKNLDLDRLANYMTGTFNSAAQAALDSAFFDITLHMYPIWKGREGVWLYVEQAVTANQAKPYRQRIYRLEKDGPGSFKSIVYTIHQEKDFVGAWQTPEKFDALTMDGVELKAGCEVMLKIDAAGNYSGSTGAKTCPSELRGASYATSKVTVYPDKIISWDQGFNDKDEQVWGATKGGYEFVKQKK